MYMFNWLFKKREEKDFTKKFEEIESILKNSFLNIKKDMKLLSEHTEVSHSKHSQHEENFENLHRRLLALENLIRKEDIPNLEKDEPELEENDDEHLTEISQKICMILAALNKENPDKLIALKILAEEMYPEKKYRTIRSTISQYTTELEKMNYIQKKKRGRQVFLRSTNKNPYLNKKNEPKKKVKIKN